MKRRLTDIALENLAAPSSGRIEIFDTLMPGLAVRVGITNRKSWSFNYRIAGRATMERGAGCTG